MRQDDAGLAAVFFGWKHGKRKNRQGYFPDEENHRFDDDFIVEDDLHLLAAKMEMWLFLVTT
ncbi:hypothetical protein IID10_11870 [candidate division KSB1 bacterium]|nr:hypothetical protein [candidate division KSB1 bacterium]